MTDKKEAHHLGGDGQSIGTMLSEAILAHYNVSITIPANGEYVRFNEKGTTGGNTPFWAFNNGLYGVFGDWRTKESHVVTPDEDIDPEKAAEARRKAEEAKRQYEQERRDNQARTAILCRSEWPTLQMADLSHPYLVAKEVKPHNLRQSGTRLVVPLSDGERLVNFQFIAPDGSKKFRAGGQITGCYFPMGEIREDRPLLICEGYSTGASLHEATGYAVACAMNCGNLQPVAESLRRRYPTQQIVIAADNDHEKPVNAGLEAGRNAARFIGAGLIHPPEVKGVSDFNDWLRADGKVEL